MVSAMATPPGWYPDGSGNNRWWDGSQWTDHIGPARAVNAADAPTLTELKPPSETLAGKELEAFNARVAGRKAAFARAAYDAQFNAKALAVLRGMGLNLIEKEMPDGN